MSISPQAARQGGGTGRRHVVVVGGGFGGVATARALARADVDVTVVDRLNHQLFQPLLYQVAAGGLSEGECATPIRSLLRGQRNARVLMEEVVDVDVERRTLRLAVGDDLPYDSLVVAAGAENSYFGNEDWAEHSLPMKTLADGIALRNRVFGALERAERSTDDEERRRWLRFVVIGGGPTGVEIVGQLAVLSRQFAPEFSRISGRPAEAILVDAGDRLVPAFSPRLSAKVRGYLQSLGVTVTQGAKVTAIDPDGVELERQGGKERIEAGTVVWAAGVRGASLGAALATATGAPLDRGGRLEVGPDCALPGHPEISVIGDLASHRGEDGDPLPGLATVAIQQGRHVAAGIGLGLPGAASPFRYFDKGALAVVGREHAVGEFRGLRLSGRVAFYTYLGVHLYYLGGTPGHRVGVIGRWFNGRFGRRSERLVQGPLETEA